MPELPEVEVTRRGFAERLTGARVLSMRLGKPLRWPLGVDPADLTGRRLVRIGRRGKYILLHLDDGGVLLVHLGMSGSLQCHGALQAPGPHDHWDLITDRGCLRLHDPRRFGAVVWSRGVEQAPARTLLAALGVEPLEPGFTPQAFHAALQGRRGAIKTVLLSGKVVVGVGNIYASEALFRARIRPTAPAGGLSRPRVAALHAAITDVLALAIDQGGSSLRDFVHPSGESGHFQLGTLVYDRAGQPCTVCATPVRQLRQQQRSTYFCPSCQKR